MLRDETVFLMGEDIGVHGGAFGVTRTLFDQFGPERVRCTPISENSFVGAGVGAAIAGMHPVVEIMFVDFSTLAMDQIINHAAKISYMTAGQAKIPLVIRMPQGGGAGKAIAAQHSQSLEVLYAHIPGLTVVHPSTAYDAKGLLKSAIRCGNPVVFLEHKLLYSFKNLVPKAEYLLPLGACDVKRPGRDLTIVANGYMVWLAMQTADMFRAEGVEIEVVDVMTVSPPRPQDDSRLGEEDREGDRRERVASIVQRGLRVDADHSGGGLRLPRGPRAPRDRARHAGALRIQPREGAVARAQGPRSGHQGDPRLLGGADAG